MRKSNQTIFSNSRLLWIMYTLITSHRSQGKPPSKSLKLFWFCLCIQFNWQFVITNSCFWLVEILSWKFCDFIKIKKRKWKQHKFKGILKRRFENLPIPSSSYGNNMSKISHKTRFSFLDMRKWDMWKVFLQTSRNNRVG